MHSLDQNVPIRVTKYDGTGWDSFAYFEGETYIGSRGMIGKYDGYTDDSPAWGSSNWAVDEWGGSGTIAFNLAASISQSGRTFKIGVRFASNGFKIAVEQLSLFMKLGREGR